MSALGFFLGRRLTEYFNVAMMNSAEVLGFQPKNNLTFEEHLDIFSLGTEDKTILLDTTGLELLDFNPGEEIRKRVTMNSKRSTLDYFSGV